MGRTYLKRGGSSLFQFAYRCLLPIDSTQPLKEGGEYSLLLHWEMVNCVGLSIQCTYLVHEMAVFDFLSRKYYYVI